MVKTYSKRGISGVITVVIMVALVMAAAAIVWAIVNNTLKGEVEGAKSCFGNFNKITINPIYTCYDSGTDTVQFSLSIGEIEVDEVLVAIASAGVTKSYTLAESSYEPGTGLTRYDGGNVQLPGQNEGLTYIASGYTSQPDLIQIKPTINGESCEVSDELTGIESCSLIS